MDDFDDDDEDDSAKFRYDATLKDDEERRELISPSKEIEPPLTTAVSAMVRQLATLPVVFSVAACCVQRIEDRVRHS